MKKTAKKTATVSVSTFARDLIIMGLSNEEVWDALKKTFKLDDSKKHYPSWYRCEMRRKGVLA